MAKNSGRRSKQLEGASSAIQPQAMLNQAADSDSFDLSKEQRIWQVVQMIPPGRVASYGQIAALAGLPGLARFVGGTMGKLPKDTSLPWHRVVKACLSIAPRDSARMREQKQRLKDEGVPFNGQRVHRSCQWKP